MKRGLEHHRWLSYFTIGGVLLVTIGSFASTANALDPNTKDPYKIVKASNAQDDGDRFISRSTWTLTDSTGRKRERVVQQWRLDFPEGTKNLLIYESPADVRNTGFLSIDYSDSKKEDDQWIYLPSLHKSTRIASSDKSDSFLGTDLTYYDMAKSNVDESTYKMIEGSVKVGNDDCWLIEATPKSAKEKKESGYIKTHLWISKQSLLPVQIKAWVEKGRKLKYIKFSGIKKVDGIWTPHKISVRTVQNKKVESETVISVMSAKYNQSSINDADFTKRRLEKGL